MKAYISAFNGKSRIELVDDIHVEIKRENIEPLNRAHKPTLRAGRFYAN